MHGKHAATSRVENSAQNSSYPLKYAGNSYLSVVAILLRKVFFEIVKGLEQLVPFDRQNFRNVGGLCETILHLKKGLFRAIDT